MAQLVASIWDREFNGDNSVNGMKMRWPFLHEDYLVLTPHCLLLLLLLIFETDFHSVAQASPILLIFPPRYNHTKPHFLESQVLSGQFSSPRKQSSLCLVCFSSPSSPLPPPLPPPRRSSSSNNPAPVGKTLRSGVVDMFSRGYSKEGCNFYQEKDELEAFKFEVKNTPVILVLGRQK